MDHSTRCVAVSRYHTSAACIARGLPAPSDVYATTEPRREFKDLWSAHARRGSSPCGFAKGRLVQCRRGHCMPCEVILLSCKLSGLIWASCTCRRACSLPVLQMCSRPASVQWRRASACHVRQRSARAWLRATQCAWRPGSPLLRFPGNGCAPKPRDAAHLFTRECSNSNMHGDAHTYATERGSCQSLYASITAAV